MNQSFASVYHLSLSYIKNKRRKKDSFRDLYIFKEISLAKKQN